jgi:hypothetical protein
MLCLVANSSALFRDLAEHATTLAEGKSFKACVKSCETLPQPMRPQRRLGHWSGSDTDGSSRGGGACILHFVMRKEKER